MVNYGASQGCITCKKRRVKCDETKPTCKECIRLRRRCSGYEKHGIRVRFKDETARYMNRRSDDAANLHGATHGKSEKRRRCTSTLRQLCAVQGHVAILSNPQCRQQDFAFTFFLRYVASVGRSLESTRGFLEFVCPVLALESHDSALSAAISATSFRLWALLRPSDADPSLLVHMHNQAVVKMQQAIESPTEQNKQATVFAALMLQYHATLTAVDDHYGAQSTHRDGALALLTQNNHHVRNFQYRRYLLGNCLHSKVSSCVRHKVPISESELRWLQTDIVPEVPNNPSSLLDIIGISISRLQSTLDEYFSSQGALALGALQELPNIICEVDDQLQVWSDTIPKFWHPKRIGRRNITPSSIVTYHGCYDIYPSIQIANICNTWRLYRLIVEFTKMAFACDPLVVSGRAEILRLNDRVSLDGTGVQHLQEIQYLCDSICRSVPFYLGNCHQPMSFHDIDSPQLVFPSYHDLSPKDEAFITYKRSDNYIPRIDHYRHVALHGPLHALSILSSLIGLFPGNRCSISETGVLHKQKQWIDEQFRRCLRLTRFLPGRLIDTGKPYQVQDPEYVRQALRTVTIT